MVRFNEGVIIENDLDCGGDIRCRSLQAATPPAQVPLPESVVDWTVRGNLAVQGRTTLFVADTQYLTAGRATIGNTLPVADGTVNLGDGSTAFNTIHAAQVLQTSSLSKKRDVQACPAGLDLVRQLRPVSFLRIATDTTQYGFVAEEVNALDGCLATDQAVDYVGILAPLVGAVQELATRVDDLTKKRTTKPR